MWSRQNHCAVQSKYAPTLVQKQGLFYDVFECVEYKNAPEGFSAKGEASSVGNHDRAASLGILQCANGNIAADNLAVARTQFRHREPVATTKVKDHSGVLRNLPQGPRSQGPGTNFRPVIRRVPDFLPEAVVLSHDPSFANCRRVHWLRHDGPRTISCSPLLKENVKGPARLQSSSVQIKAAFSGEAWDLLVAIGYTVLMAGVLIFLDYGSLPAILLVLLLPGYVLVAALFPGNAKIDWVERVALSFGLSVAVVPLLGLLLNFTPWGIRFAPIVVTITLFTVGVGYAAHWRRMRLPADQRLSLTVDFAIPDWKEHTRFDKGLTVALAASIVAAGGTLAYVVLALRA